MEIRIPSLSTTARSRPPCMQPNIFPLLTQLTFSKKTSHPTDILKKKLLTRPTDILIFKKKTNFRPPDRLPDCLLLKEQKHKFRPRLLFFPNKYNAAAPNEKESGYKKAKKIGKVS